MLFGLVQFINLQMMIMGMIYDYCDIMDEFGTMEDMDNLLKEAMKRNKDSYGFSC